jgi:hypothetical protein
MGPAGRAGLGSSLSDCEDAVGFEREDDPGGLGAVRLWDLWDRRGEEEALLRLVSYNRDDVRAMVPIARELARRECPEVAPVAEWEGGVDDPRGKRADGGGPAEPTDKYDDDGQAGIENFK